MSTSQSSEPIRVGEKAVTAWTWKIFPKFVSPDFLNMGRTSFASSFSITFSGFPNGKILNGSTHASGPNIAHNLVWIRLRVHDERGCKGMNSYCSTGFQTTRPSYSETWSFGLARSSRLACVTQPKKARTDPSPYVGDVLRGENEDLHLTILTNSIEGFSLCFRSHQMLIVLLRSRHGFRTVPGDVRELSDLEKLVSIAVRQAGGPVFGSN